MAETAPTINSPRRRTDPTTSAWIVLLTFFFVFCVVIGSACFAGWWYYANAMVKGTGTIVRVHVPTGVNYQARDSTNRSSPSKPCTTAPTTEKCQELAENDRVLAVPQAGYGPVASVLLPDHTHIQLWAYPTGADLTLAHFKVSRWSHRRQEVTFAQQAGYARYDIPPSAGQAYGEMSYTVAISRNISIDMAPGGSYSVDIAQKHLVMPTTDLGTPLMAEIAVRSGSLVVRNSAGEITVQPGQKVQIDTSGMLGGIQLAQWNLIRDGDFEQYMGGAPADGIQTWAVHGFIFDQTVSDAEKQAASMTMYRSCHPTTPSAFLCPKEQTVLLAQFERQGNQSKSYSYGIEQVLDLDVSEYRSMQFVMWARVISQSVPNAGVTNNECPITVRFTFKRESPSDKPEFRFLCLYRTSERKPIPNGGEYVYQAVSNQALWYHMDFDLRDPKYDLLQSARYIESVAIYGNGHDYISQVTDISLTARQQR
jgi:hypothetical protein